MLTNKKIRKIVNEYDKLVDSKLDVIRNSIKSNIQVKDDDELFYNQLSDSIISSRNKFNDILLLSDSFERNIKYSPTTALKKYQNLNLINYFKKKYMIIKKKLLYYYSILYIYKINKIKKLFPELSKKRIINLINSVKINDILLKQNI